MESGIGSITKEEHTQQLENPIHLIVYMPVDPKDPSPCIECPMLTEWRRKQWAKLRNKETIKEE